MGIFHGINSTHWLCVPPYLLIPLCLEKAFTIPLALYHRLPREEVGKGVFGSHSFPGEINSNSIVRREGETSETDLVTSIYCMGCLAF